MLFKSFHKFCLLREAANRSIAHLIDLAHSDRLMVIISSYRNSRDQEPPRSIDDLEGDIRRMQGFEVIHNPICANNNLSRDNAKAEGIPWEVEGAKAVAELPYTGEMGVTKARGGFKEKIKSLTTGQDELDDNGEPKQRDVCEDSLIVSHKRGKNHPTDEQVIEFFTQLCQKYHQEAFLFKSPSGDEIQYYYADGRAPDNLGVFTGVSTLEPYFTMLRRGPNYNDRRVAAKPRPTPADRLNRHNQ